MPEMVQARRWDCKAEGWAILLSRNKLLDTRILHKATVPKKSPSPTACSHQKE